MARGFTLLEMLVVLALTALIASVTLPNLQRLSESVSVKAGRESLVGQLDELPYRAYAFGNAFSLSNDTLATVLKDGQRVLDPPPDWRIEVPRPVYYDMNGFCSGGTVIARLPDATVETFLIQAPRCKAGG